MKDRKLLVIDRENRSIRHLHFSELSSLLSDGDLCVVNDSATLPASFQGTHLRTGKAVELRLAALKSESLNVPEQIWRGVVFGEGDWHLPTERRALPPLLKPGDELDLGGGLAALVTATDPESSRWVDIRFSALGDLLSAIYRQGRLIQYSYLKEELPLWAAQTIFARLPVSVEAPSASFGFYWGQVLELERKGVAISPLTHSAGISSTGDPRLDQKLPLPERYSIPAETAAQVSQALARGGRVIAIGTTVLRALESAQGRSGDGVATLRLGPGSAPAQVTALLTGLHEPGSSHLELLKGLVPGELLSEAYAQAERLGYQWHEFGDSCLILI